MSNKTIMWKKDSNLFLKKSEILKYVYLEYNFILPHNIDFIACLNELLILVTYNIPTD